MVVCENILKKILTDNHYQTLKFYNPNLHNIARSDRTGFTTKNEKLE